MSQGHKIPKIYNYRLVLTQVQVTRTCPETQYNFFVTVENAPHRKTCCFKMLNCVRSDLPSWQVLDLLSSYVVNSQNGNSSKMDASLRQTSKAGPCTLVTLVTVTVLNALKDRHLPKTDSWS